MQRNKYVISRTTTAKAAVILRESEFTTPRQYLDLRIFLFDGSRITWADSDRLDLPRLGIKPTPEKMATEKGAIMADG